MRRALLLTLGILTLTANGCARQTSAARSAPSPSVTDAQHLPDNYEPRHKGAVDLASGLYYRENEDLVLPGRPALILRRTYLANYHASKQFGVGALHNGEEYLIGDGQQFQWISLILARGSRINFRRVSPGTSHFGARFVHDETETEWRDAQLHWSGLTWLLERADGSTMVFKGCGVGTVCSIIKSQDADGHAIYYRRSFAGVLLKMDDGAGRWIAFDYDERGRISRAHASTGRQVRYDYDERGRLTRAAASDGLVYRYTYTDLDELATIEEPGTSIENSYKDGRCVHQVNRYPGDEPLIFDFSYRLEGKRVSRTESRRSDGTYESFTFDESRRTTTATFGAEGYDPIAFAYERDPATKALTALTVTCPDLGTGAFRRTVSATAANRDQVKAQLVAQCLGVAGKR
jgi:YD repeat-containing protein